jgi:Ser/Thr protein kinase RdoA (MazF antagonist)
LTLTEAQTQAIAHVARCAPDLPLPHPVPARDGRRVIPLADGALRLFTWCQGTPIAHLPPSEALARAIGTALARLDAALADLPPGPHDRPLLWDICAFASLSPLLPALPADLQAQAAQALQAFTSRTAPALARLSRQPIHGDFNPHNLLADPADPARLTGILDFGDMTYSPRLCDLAVAASYLVDPVAPLRYLTPLLAAYHAQTPLDAEELALLPSLITARLWATVTITAWRANRYPENAPYILRNAPLSRAGLAALATLPPDDVAQRLAAACESPRS